MSKPKSREVSVELKDISKIYTIHHEKPTLVENLINAWKRDTFKALDNINLTIYRGEKIGIVGHNGSGKTTILKIISKITTPTSGQVKVYGKVVSLIDLTAGFHPDLTGEENIYLNGLVVGMNRKEIDSKLKKIIEFVDIGEFIHAPLYTYSDGMKLRLGFSIAVHSDPDVLVLDEGIAAGDAEFHKKIGKKIDSFFRANKTIIVVTHSPEYLKMYCKRVIHFERGKIINDCDISEVKI